MVVLLNDPTTVKQFDSIRILRIYDLILCDRYCIGSIVIRCHVVAYSEGECSSWGSHIKGVAMRAIIVLRSRYKIISRLTINIHDPT